MTYQSTAPAGAANRRSCADGTGTTAPVAARPPAGRAGVRILAALGLGLAANLALVDGALAPATAIARPGPCCVPALAPLDLARTTLFNAATRTGLVEIRDVVTQIGSPTTADAGLGALAGLVRQADATLRREAAPVRFGAMRVERWIVTAVTAAAARTGGDPVFMLALADKESSLRPGVGAQTSSAEGLYQFIEQTWLEVLYSFGEDHGLADEAGAIVKRNDGRFVIEDEETRESILALRRDPLISGLMAGEMLARDRARLEEALDRRLAPHEVYVAHFLGRGGAARFLAFKDSHPDAAAAAEFGAAARANRAIFYQNGRPLSYAEVDARIAEAIGARVDRYASVAPFTEAARARRLARLLSQETAVYASLKGAEMEMIEPEASGEEDGALAFAMVAGENGETVPLPPRR